jgi:hypothetical protein
LYDLQRREICMLCKRALCKLAGWAYKFQNGHRCQQCYKEANQMRKREQKAVTVQRATSGMKRSASLLNSGSVTPQHAEKLLNTIHAQHKRGKTRSAEDNARAIYAVYAEVSKPRAQRSLSFDGVVKQIAGKEHVSATTLRASIKRFVQEGVLHPFPAERLTRAHPEHPLYLESGPPLRVQELLFRVVAEAQEENYYVSLTTLRAALLRELDMEVPRATW